METAEELKLVYDALQQAKEYGLEAEVVLYAMKALKDDEILTIGEALACGLGEWIK
jgi:hypothetical protein